MWKLALPAVVAAVLSVAAYSAPSVTLAADPLPYSVGDESYEEDIAFLLKEFGEKAKEPLKIKGIDWKKVTKEFNKRAKEIETDHDLVKVASELVARLQDGHATLRDFKVDLEGYGGPPIAPCGLDLYEFSGKWYVKRAVGNAEKSGVKPGWEVVKIDGEKAVKWMDAAQERLCVSRGFSTPAAARFITGTWGVVGPDGDSVRFEFKAGRKKRKVTLQWARKQGGYLTGPVVFPEGIKMIGKNIGWAVLPDGYGYMWVGSVPVDLPEMVDQAIAGVGDDCPGMVLDFRSSSGGSYDRDTLLGRFVPKGKSFGGEESKGPKPFTGHIVVLVDPATISASETIVGEMKEDGRAYLIGPGGTHGASGSKALVTVPSGKLAARFVTHSHKSWMNGGKGVEGIGIAPDEIVEYDPKMLADGIDPCIARAVDVLKKGPPKKAVTYVPPKSN